MLLTGARCGFVDVGLATDNLTLIDQIYGPARAKDLLSADQYARQCYTATSGTLYCDTYVKTRLEPSIVNTTARCPFRPEVCRHANSNLLLDTGYLDSHEDFGRNAPPDQRFYYRRIVHCSPLETEGYSSYTNLSADKSYIRYQYGNATQVNGSTLDFTAEFSRDDYYSVRDISENHGNTNYDYSVR